MSASSIPRVPVESTSLASIGHCVRQRVLEVEFRNGGLYRYFNVPAEAYDALLGAESKGAHFNRFVRPRFSYERLRLRPALLSDDEPRG